MSRKEIGGLEFEQDNSGAVDVPAKPLRRESDKDKQIRHAYRLTKDVGEDVKVALNGKSFLAVDLGYEGVGVRVSKNDKFPSAGEELTINISFDGGTHEVTGKVVHVSPDFSDQYLCGIKFLGDDSSFAGKLEAFLDRGRSSLFGGQ